MNNFKDNPTYKATEEEFLEACKGLPQAKINVRKETDEALQLKYMMDLGDIINTIQSYVYDMNGEDCAAFAEWVVTFFVLQNQFYSSISNKPEIPSVKNPQSIREE